MRTTSRDFIGSTVLVIFFGGVSVIYIPYLFHKVINPAETIASNTYEIKSNFRTAEFMRTLERIEKNSEDIKYLLLMGMDEYQYNTDKIRRMMDLDKGKLNLMK